MTTLRNSVRTPDGTELVSRYRHDMVCHKDANGKRYCIDGGNDYFRAVGDIGDCEDTSLHSGMAHQQLREGVEWGTYGVPTKTKTLKWVLIKDLEQMHITAILGEEYVSKSFRKLLIDELQWRKDRVAEGVGSG